MVVYFTSLSTRNTEAHEERLRGFEKIFRFSFFFFQISQEVIVWASINFHNAKIGQCGSDRMLWINNQRMEIASLATFQDNFRNLGIILCLSFSHRNNVMKFSVTWIDIYNEQTKNFDEYRNLRKRLTTTWKMNSETAHVFNIALTVSLIYRLLTFKTESFIFKFPWTDELATRENFTQFLGIINSHKNRKSQKRSETWYWKYAWMRSSQESEKISEKGQISWMNFHSTTWMQKLQSFFFKFTDIRYFFKLKILRD